MAKDIFTMDQKSFKELNKVIKQSNKMMNRAGVSVINEMAFESRRLNIRSITNFMTIRSPGFLKSSMRVDPSKSTRLDKARAIVGSISKKGSTGWAEQELGTRDTRDRTISKAARVSGDFRKKVSGKARLKTQNKFKKWNQWQRKGGGYRHHTKEQATVAMMVDARKGKFKGRFIINNVNNLRGRLSLYRDGLYHVKGKRIIRDQNFEKSPKQTGRDRWMTRANNNLGTTFDINKSWDKSFAYQLNKNSSVKKLKK